MCVSGRRDDSMGLALALGLALLSAVAWCVERFDQF